MAENSIIKNNQNLGITNSTSETLATQGNVINSLISFWEKLKTKLNLAVTRDTSKAIGSEYIPVYVNQDGEVKECNTEIIGITSVGNNSLGENTIKLNANGNNPSIKITVKPVIGTMVCLSLPNYSSNNATELRIQDGNNVSSLVYYTSGISVQVKDLAGQAAKYLLVYSKDGNNAGRWILLNKINEVISSGGTLENQNVTGGKAGLMSSYDKAKLDSIAWGARRTLSWLDMGTMPVASKDSRGGVKLGSDTPINLNDNKVYPVQVNNDGQMGVSVPWQNTNTHYNAIIKVGSTENTADMGATSNDNTYVKIFENGAYSSSFSIKGAGGTTVSSENNSNEILITSQAGIPTFGAGDAGKFLVINSDENAAEWKSFQRLRTLKVLNNYVFSNYATDTNYLVAGPGEDKANTSNFLAGNGSWVAGILVPKPGTGDYGKTLKCDNNGNLYWG